MPTVIKVIPSILFAQKNYTIIELFILSSVRYMVCREIVLKVLIVHFFF